MVMHVYIYMYRQINVANMFQIQRFISEICHLLLTSQCCGWTTVTPRKRLASSCTPFSYHKASISNVTQSAYARNTSRCRVMTGASTCFRSLWVGDNTGSHRAGRYRRHSQIEWCCHICSMIYWAPFGFCQPVEKSTWSDLACSTFWCLRVYFLCSSKKHVKK